MTGALDVATAVLLVIGGLFCVVGGIGLHRFSDFYQRTHAASVTDTAGAGLMLLGLMFQGGVSMVTLKLILVLTFLLFTSPAIAHALVKAAHGHGLALELEVSDEETDPGPGDSGPAAGGE
ncbi:MAG: monovalent cation/H(+) antiporter subunit G [Acidobacteria bacterium]|nr:monovalent cation/H(+) antiporter subunit G [Acidobacteriota bacterium]